MIKRIFFFFARVRFYFNDHLLPVGGKPFAIEPVRSRVWTFGMFIEELGPYIAFVGIGKHFLLVYKNEFKDGDANIIAPINSYATKLLRGINPAAKAVRGEAFLIRKCKCPDYCNYTGKKHC